MTTPSSLTLLSDAAHALTPLQWFQISTRDEEGPVPPGCGNGELAEDLLHFLQAPYPHVASLLAQQLTVPDTAAAFPALQPFAEALAAWLDAHRPAWRDDRPVSDDARERTQAHLDVIGRWGGDAPRCDTTAAREHWDELYRRALVRLAYPPPPGERYPVGWLDGIKEALAGALLAGAPPAVVSSLWAAARAMFRAHVGIDPDRVPDEWPAAPGGAAGNHTRVGQSDPNP